MYFSSRKVVGLVKLDRYPSYIVKDLVHKSIDIGIGVSLKQL